MIPNNKGAYVMPTLDELNVLKSKYPLPSTFILPYRRPLLLPAKLMNIVMAMREAGFVIKVRAYIPEQECEDAFCMHCSERNLEGPLSLMDSYKVKEITLLVPGNEYMPVRYTKALLDTHVQTFRLWDLETRYFYETPNNIVFVLHIPDMMWTNSYRLPLYLEALFSYLKPSFPRALVTILTTGLDSEQPSSPYVTFTNALEATLATSAFLCDHLEGGLPYPRNKDETKISQYDISLDIPGCACRFCTKQAAIGEHTFTWYHNIWPKREDMLKRALQAKADPVNTGPAIEAIEIDEIIQNSILKQPQYALSTKTHDQLTKLDADICAMYLETMHDVDQEAKGILNDEGDTLENDPHLPPCPKEVVQNHEEIVDLKHLTIAQRKVVVSLLQEFDHVISANPNDYSIIKTHMVSFDIKDETPFYCRPFPMSKLLIDILKQHLDFLTNKGFLVPDTNNSNGTIFYSNAFLVPRNAETKMAKATGFLAYRVVYNLIRLNERISSPFMGEAVPGIETMFAKFSQAKHCTIADCLERNEGPVRSSLQEAEVDSQEPEACKRLYSAGGATESLPC
jgi:hypothetical protein